MEWLCWNVAMVFRTLSRSTIRISFIGVLFLNVVMAIGGDPPAATLGIEELREGLRDAYPNLRSFELRYRIIGSPENALPKSFYVERIMVVDAPGSLMADAGHGSDVLHWTDDPNRQTAYVTPQEIINVYPADRAYFRLSLKDAASLPGSLDSEFFFFATGIWPYSRWRPPRPNGHAHMLTEIADDPEFSMLRPYQEQVDDDWCHVLSRSELDVVWIDVGHGCCIRKREIFDESTGRLAARIVSHDPREVMKNVWVPRKIENIHFDFNATTSTGRQRKLIDSIIEITHFEAKVIDDPSVFSYSPPPGALQIDPDGPQSPPRQSEPGGEDHLECVATWIRKVLAKPAATTQSSRLRMDSSVALLLVTAGLITIAEIVFFMRRLL